jgi:hypothetical protein
MTDQNNPGADRAWELLAAMKPEEVCRAAAVSYDAETGSYGIKSFGMDFDVSVANRIFSSRNPGSELLLTKLGYFFRLLVLWYLVKAKDIASTNRLIKLESVKGGEIFTRGSHVLPLEPLAVKYGRNREGFLEKGKSLGAEREKLGDAAIRLFPLPRVPVVLALWLEDAEFPSRADLLFDSTCVLQIPMDIIWSVAMTSVLVMM